MIATLLRGAAAGLIATLPMSISMGLMRRALPRREQYPLPPRQITEQFVETIGATDLSETETQALTAVSHFAYGGATGGIYGACVAQGLPANVTTGVLFGLGVWSGSYLGWLPALNVLPPATEHPARRNALMITAHVVWGAALGILTKRLQRNRRNARSVSHSARTAAASWQNTPSLAVMDRERLMRTPGRAEPLAHMR